MLGQYISVCASASMGASRTERRTARDPADDAVSLPADGRDLLPVGHLRHGRRHDPDRRSAGAAAGPGRHGAARGHANRIERLARPALAQACALGPGRRLCVRLPPGALRLVAVPLCAEHPGSAHFPGGDPVPGEAVSLRLAAESRKPRARDRLRRGLHDPDAAHRRRRPADRQFLPRRQARPPRDRRHQGDVPDHQPHAEARLFRRHHRAGRHARPDARGARHRRVDGRDDRGQALPGDDERPAVPALGEPDHCDHRRLLRHPRHHAADHFGNIRPKIALHSRSCPPRESA